MATDTKERALLSVKARVERAVKERLSVGFPANPAVITDAVYRELKLLKFGNVIQDFEIGMPSVDNVDVPLLTEVFLGTTAKPGDTYVRKLDGGDKYAGIVVSANGTGHGFVLNCTDDRRERTLRFTVKLRPTAAIETIVYEVHASEVHSVKPAA